MGNKLLIEVLVLVIVGCSNAKNKHEELEYMPVILLILLIVIEGDFYQGFPDSPSILKLLVTT
ncbi:hypothetical protein SB49_02175 [Sediminicola sp. YIK13]|nr:hypothetical protein SB49_02175 [Sediminicola sp. YIK13]